MRNLKVSPAVREKLALKHGVEVREVEQCFCNRSGPLLMDTREDHATDPPTLWFLAHTHRGRLLKVVYIQFGSSVTLKTCYEPNEAEVNIYRQWSPS